MTDKKESSVSDIFSKFVRYLSIFFSQCAENREFIYFLLLGIIADITLMTIIHPWGWIMVSIFNLLIGLFAIGVTIRRVERAFESLGLDYEKGYGKPHWLIQGKYPAAQEVIRINAAGYGPADYEKYLGHIAARLNHPVREVRKPVAHHPVLEVVLKRSHLPEVLRYADLPLGDLRPGEFFVGKTEEGLEKLSLKQMVHLLVAGQTGSGKTQFLRQFIATSLSHIRESYVALIDMKGGIDFQNFLEVPNFNLVSNYRDAEAMLTEVISLFEFRKEYLLAKKKTNWAELSLKELEHESSMKGRPIGPVIVVVDELAELSKRATERSSKSPLQEQLATLARLSRFTGIHLVLGTQRPDKSTLDMQSKDNLPTRICFSVPSVTASTLVVGDMSASTLGNIPGRAVYQLSGSKIIQSPYIENTELKEMMDKHSSKLNDVGYNRGIGRASHATPAPLLRGPKV